MVLVWLAALQVAVASDSIHGVVRQRDGSAVTDAIVELAQRARRVRTDAEVTVRLLGRDWRAGLVVRNLTNTAYRDFLSRYKAFAQNPGRSIVVRLSTGW